MTRKEYRSECVAHAALQSAAQTRVEWREVLARREREPAPRRIVQRPGIFQSLALLFAR